MSRKRNKNMGIDIGDLPSNYILKIKNDVMDKEQEYINMIPDEFIECNNIITGIDMYNDKKN